MTIRTPWIAVLLALTYVSSGCNSQSPSGSNTTSETAPNHDAGHDHDHSHEQADHSTTFTSAVSELATLHRSIASAFAAGRPEDCHESLHSVGHLLTELPELAADTSLPRADWQKVKDASSALMKDFGRIDAKMHGDQDGCDYAEVAATIEQQLNVLTTLAEQEQAADPAADPAVDNVSNADGVNAS